MKKLMAATALGLVLLAGPARADYIFLGLGPSGSLVAPSETWSYGANNQNWGSPGVGLLTVPYGESQPAVDFEIIFPGATIDSASITLGSASHCVGGSGGGTTFCAAPYATPWTPLLISAGSIAFFAPSGTSLQAGGHYFVNVFFSRAPTSQAFVGAWTTGLVPEPATFGLLGAGLIGLAACCRRLAKT